MSEPKTKYKKFRLPVTIDQFEIIKRTVGKHGEYEGTTLAFQPNFNRISDKGWITCAIVSKKCADEMKAVLDKHYSGSEEI